MKANKNDLHESGRVLTKEEFINKIKTDDEFAKKWGNLGKIYGFQWRNWGGWTDTKQTGFLHKTDNGWSVKWSDLHSFANGTEWMTTPIQDSDQSLYGDEDEGRKVYYKNITLGYDEKSFIPIQVAKVIDDKFDKYVGGTDQIANLIRDLKTNPDSRRLMVNAWNVSDLPHQVLPPCHYGFQVYTRELSLEEKWEQYSKSGLNIEINGTPLELKHMGTPFYPKSLPQRAISLMWNQRSVDTGLGLPFNIASYGLLLEIIAKAVNMVPDELIGSLGDTHLYSNHIEPIKEQMGRELSLEERKKIFEDRGYVCDVWPFNGNWDGEYDGFGIPRRTREPFDLPTLKHMKTDDFYKSLGEDLSLITHLEPSDFTLENYQSHPTIKLPLSN